MKKPSVCILLIALLVSLDIVATLPEPCPKQELNFPLSAQTPIGFSGNELLASFFISPALPFNWRDEAPTIAHVSFVPASDNARVVVYGQGNHCASGDPEMFIDGLLTIQTEDGKPDIRCNTTIDAMAIDYGWIWAFSSSCNDLQLILGPSIYGDDFTTTLGLHVDYRGKSEDNLKMNGWIFRSYRIPISENAWQIKNYILAIINEGFPRLIIEPGFPAVGLER